jgi:hypothetical protein
VGLHLPEAAQPLGWLFLNLYAIHTLPTHRLRPRQTGKVIMREPRSYIVRIYRQGYLSLVGIVEDIHTRSKQPFRNIQELAALLRASITSAPLAERKEVTFNDTGDGGNDGIS